MVSRVYLVLIGIFFAITASPLPLFAGANLLSGNPGDEISMKIACALLKKKQPVLLFDLDDTVYLTKYRSHAILTELGHNEKFLAQFKDQGKKLQNLDKEKGKYRVADTLVDAGLSKEYDKDLLGAAFKYWGDRFFTSIYLSYDQPVAGAVKYLNSIPQNTQIVYLTGREASKMLEGTKSKIALTEIPTPGADPRVNLFLKLDGKLSDVDYKKQAFEEIAKLGEVVAVIENEPKNLAAMQKRFPEAVPVLVDTARDSGLEVLSEDFHFVKDYTKFGTRVVPEEEAKRSCK